MSRSAPLSFSESINGITCRRRLQVRLERIAIDHVHRALEQARDVIFEAHVFIDRTLGLWFEFHQYVEVTIRTVVAACDRAEHRGMTDAPCAQRALVTAQDGNGSVEVRHTKSIAQDAGKTHSAAR